MRLILLILSITFGALSPMDNNFFLFIGPFMWSCVNDVYMLTWDTYTYGSFLATLIPQTITSLAGIAFNVIALVDPGWSPIATLLATAQFFSSFANAALFAIHWYLWVKGSRSFKRGVKEMRGPSKPESGVSVFGWKRSDSERRRFWRILPRWFSSIIFRRIENVESYTSAATRNIFAMFLLAILIVQSVVLFRSVIYEVFSNRVTSPTLGEVLLVPNDAVVYGIIHERESDQYWSPHVLFSTSGNISTPDIINTATSCDPLTYWILPQEIQKDLETCRSLPGPNPPLAPAGVLDIALTVSADPDSVLKPGGIWIESCQTYTDNQVRVYHGYSVSLTPGYHLFGFVEFIEWSYIQPSFLEALGFNPAYYQEYPAFVNWIGQTQLDNISVARATLQLPPPQAQISRVVLEYRTHTFLGALTSIGGLLAIFQGIHLLCFGRPLFWGLFGSKLLDPFGIFGRLSNDLQGKIRQKYFLEPSNTLDLHSFLNDFVIEMGPLDPEEQDGSENVDEIE